MTEFDIPRREWIEERMAIREFEAGMPRVIAEVMARQDWKRYAEEQEAR